MPKTTRQDEQARQTDPPTLLAILIGARRTGDRALESVIRRALEKDHRIKVLFLAERREVTPCA